MGGKETGFVCIPGHVGIRENVSVDSAAKNASDGNISGIELVPISDLKPHLLLLELLQPEWDE